MSVVAKRRIIDSRKSRDHLEALERTHRATLNILEDFDSEKEKPRLLQIATMNVLQDFDLERRRSRLFQKAILNLLEDMDTDKKKLKDTQRALLNMLEDIEGERGSAERAKSLLSLVNSQLVTAQESERRRVSYDLHDYVWQTLLGIRFGIERLFSGQEDWGALRDRSKQVRADLLGVVEKIRAMQGDLWPYVLDDIGIVATIEWYCRDFERSHSGLFIEKRNDAAEGEIPSSAKIVIYRILQETLSNVVKHSQANHVTVALMKRDHRIEFTIEDNGIGFDLEEVIARNAPWGGLGLSSIKARTELSGGSFGVESVKGKGTTVRASWPLHADA